jgi:hypothetical protein
MAADVVAVVVATIDFVADVVATFIAAMNECSSFVKRGVLPCF